MSCTYFPVITAEFGKIITDTEINHEFQMIEEAMTCFEEAIGSVTTTEENIYDHGIIDNSYTIEPAFGILHYMELQGDVELEIAQPPAGTSRLITLIIANAGSISEGNYGRFNLRAGTVWSADRDDIMDGKPWNMYANLTGDTSGTKYDGFYGAVVSCIHDGNNWIHLAYARHHLDIWAANPNPDDIYDWR